MSILKNAVESIQIGMIDFHDDDPRRVLSAIRNLYAGILLLFKFKLQELSPSDSDEALLKTKVLPKVDQANGYVTWVGKGKKTVDVQEIIERLKALDVDGIEWSRLEALQKIRNETEHYYSSLPAERLKEAVANSLQLITQFCEPYLGTHPVDILGQECWEMMLDVGAVYERELSSCRENLESVDWPFDTVRDCITHMRCPECGSELICVIDTGAKRESICFECSSCRAQSSYSQVISPAVVEGMWGANYISVKDGGDAETETCPECSEGTFLVKEGQCAACFYELEYVACLHCEQGLSVAEQDLDGLCSYCRYRYDKIMAE